MRKLLGNHPDRLPKEAVEIIKLTMEEASETKPANLPFYK